MLICQCPTCATKFPRPDDASGEVATCPNCGNFIPVPDPPAVRIHLALIVVVLPVLILLGMIILAYIF